MEIFARFGIVEHKRHGIPVIVSKYGKEVFEISDSYIRVIIPFNKEVLLNHSYSFEIEENKENLELKEETFFDVDKKENKVFRLIQLNPQIKTKEISEALNIPFRSVQRYIAALKEEGFIERVGANKNGYWKVIK